MESRGIIENRGVVGVESFYLNDTNSSDMQNGDNNNNVLDTITSFQTFIDEKFYNIFTERIKSEVNDAVKNHLELLNVNNPNSDRVINNTDQKTLIDTLNSEITFLRNELNSKDKIIELLIKDKPVTATINDDKVENVINSMPVNNPLNHDDMEVINKNPIDESSTEQNENDKFIVISNKKKSNKRSITIIGDSTVKDIKSFKMRKALSSSDKIYVKSFPGAKSEDMIDYIKPSLKYNPDLLILHVGTNSLRSNKTSEEIAEDITKLATEAKSNAKDIIISGIIPRNDDVRHIERKTNPSQ